MRNVDSLMGFQKHAFTQCNVMLDCQSCNAASSFMMLLVVISQRLMSSFEGLLQALDGSFARHSDNDGPSQQGECGKKRLGHLGDFDIDRGEEWACLIGGLIMLQLKSLAAFLERLNGFAAGHKWDTHRAMLHDVERQMRTTASRLRHIRLGLETIISAPNTLPYPRDPKVVG